jgi:hypothetical protein
MEPSISARSPCPALLAISEDRQPAKIGLPISFRSQASLQIHVLTKARQVFGDKLIGRNFSPCSTIAVV